MRFLSAFGSPFLSVMLDRLGDTELSVILDLLGEEAELFVRLERLLDEALSGLCIALDVGILQESKQRIS